MGSNLNSTNSDLIKSGPGPHPRVLVYKKEVRKPPLDLLATNGGYMFSLCPFLPRVLYSKEQKELRVKRIEVFPSNSISPSLIVFPLSFASSNIARMDWTYCGRQQETHRAT